MTVRFPRTAVEFHLQGLRDSSQPIPDSSTSAAYVEVAA